MVIYEGFSLFMTGPKYFVGITQSQEHTCEGWKSSESGLYRDCDVTKTMSRARGWSWVRKHEIKKFQTGTIRIWMLCYGHMRWQYLAGHQGQKAREAQPCSAANFHFGHRHRWLAPISHEKYKWYKTHFGEIKSVWDSFWSHICFPWPRPAQSVVVLEREIYGHFHSQGRWTCLVKLILWRTTATSSSFTRCQVQDRPRTELLMLLRGWKLGKLIFQSRKFAFSQFYWTFNANLHQITGVCN